MFKSVNLIVFLNIISCTCSQFYDKGQNPTVIKSNPNLIPKEHSNYIFANVEDDFWNEKNCNLYDIRRDDIINNNKIVSK